MSAGQPDPGRSVSDAGPRFPWMQIGVPGGILGALAVALFFLVVDLAHGRPFWTPAALGSRFFLGESLQPGAPVSPPLVLAYTLLHVAAFVGFASAASVALLTVRRLPASRWMLGALLALVFFAAAEIVFLGLVGLFAPELLDSLGAGRIATGNALAALTMAGWLAWRAPVRRRQSEGGGETPRPHGRDREGVAHARGG